MARRAKGEGSIFPICSTKGPGHTKRDHRRCVIEAWVGQVSVGFYAKNGRRKYARVQRRTQAEVVAEMQELRGGTAALDRSTTLAQYLAWWLENGQRDGIAESSVRTHRSVVKNWLVPYVGRVKLRDLSPDHVRKLLRDLEKLGLKPSSRAQARRILGRACKIAASDGRIPRNPVPLVDGPRLGKAAKTDDVYDRSQCRQLLATAVERTDELPDGDPFEAAAVLDVRVALRISEVRGLDWPDVDFEAHEIHIRQAKGGSVGTVPMLPEVEAPLRRRVAHQARQRLAAGPLWRGGEPGKTGPVFTSARGDRISDAALRAWWHRLCARAELPHARFHAGRHSAAEIMIDDGVPLETVSAICRHAGLAITSDVYGRQTADRKRKALAGVAARDQAAALLAELSEDQVAQVLAQLERASG